MNGTMNARILRKATFLTGLALSATFAQNKAKNPDCLALEKVQAQKSQLMEQANKLNEQGRTKKDECAALAGGKQDRCFEELKPLRSQVNALQAKIKPIQDDIDKYKALCPETQKEILQTLDLYEKVAKEACV